MAVLIIAFLQRGCDASIDHDSLRPTLGSASDFPLSSASLKRAELTIRAGRAGRERCFTTGLSLYRVSPIQ